MAFAKDYVDVATRIREFKKLHPEGSLQQVKLEFHTIGDQMFVLYVAACFRDQNDSKPGIGSAWEPVPGKTPYTKDSEVMVAETSAWGRAIVAATGADTKSIASLDEVNARKKPQETATRDWIVEAENLAFQKDKDALRVLYAEAVKKIAPSDVIERIRELGSDIK